MTGHIAHRTGNRWRVAIWGMAACLLLFPLVAMQFTREVAWTPIDFLLFGVLLFVACGTYEIATWISGNTLYRAAVAMMIGGAFLLVWSNFAVGIIRDEKHPANLLYAGVLAVLIAGVCVARFRPQGMVRALVATAFAQALVALFAMLARVADATELLAITAMFVALWLGSALLFRIASRQNGLASAR